MKQKILAVDEELSVRMLLDNFLGDDFEVITKENGYEALSWVQEGNHPDLLLVDISMPVINGYEFIESIRKFKGMSAVPILVLSAKQKNADCIKSFIDGINDYIQKPFNPEELVMRIKSAFLKAKAA